MNQDVDTTAKKGVPVAISTVNANGDKWRGERVQRLNNNAGDNSEAESLEGDSIELGCAWSKNDAVSFI